MIKALLIDDQDTNITVLENQLKKFFPNVTIAAVSTDPFEAVALTEEIRPDLLFLDIHMPGLNGFEVLERLKENTRAQVIFVTAFSEYALEAFAHQAAGYITKPVNAEQFILTVNKAIGHINDRHELAELKKNTEMLAAQHGKKLALPTQKGLVFVDPDTIYYCESAGNYTTLFLKEQKQLVVSKQIGQFEQLLPGPFFVRIHDRFIINTRHIRVYNRGNGGSVVLENDKELPVSARRKENLLRLFSSAT